MGQGQPYRLMRNQGHRRVQVPRVVSVERLGLINVILGV